ncbi:MAG: hypothetical protein J6I73_01710 [Treponema sp.]|nr:hypothetical protein [Treponema sp.]
MNEETSEFPKDFINSLKSLGEMAASSQNCAAAMLYRLMFRHEKNIHVLDTYADQVFDGIVGIGSKFAEEDYRNYLQYLKIVVPTEYEGHKEMLDDYTSEDENVSDEK